MFNRQAFTYLVTVGLFALLIKLGFWQLSRAHQKQYLEQQLISRQQAHPLTYSQLLSSNEQNLTGFKLTVSASPTRNPIFLLDNQVFKGRVGYLAYQVMQVEPEQPWLLVELGFVPAMTQRSQLPKVSQFTHEMRFSGKVYQRLLNPMSHQLLAEKGSPVRIQNININALAEYLNHPLAPAIFQPSTSATDVAGQKLAKPWQPLPMPAQKHYGYAVQWFAMATTLAVIVLWQLRKKRLKQKQA
ncbi:MAG: SURF1 family protein [Parashewanella sp.]